MKAVALVVFSLIAIGAHADFVECANSSRTTSAAYMPDSMTFEFVKLNTTGIPTPVPVAIVGEPEQVNPKVEYTSVYAYKLANGQTMEVTWDAGQSEILRNIRSRVLKMELKSTDNEIIESYDGCRWRKE